ncbi:MAG TPA: hypothetical protein VFI59_04435 [Actinomycetota bacterium]|nr:hypothetical protein [Actinomycetota bacterium]
MSHRTSRTIDVILVLWLLLWCAIGYTLGRTVNELSGLSDGVIGAGEGVSDAAGALGDFADVPLIGGGIDAIADRIDAIGQGTVQKGEASKDAIFNISLLIGLVIALGPTVPLLAVWLVIRAPLARERRRIGKALDVGDPGLDGYLALRAATRFPYSRIAGITTDPWGDLQAGRHSALASMELTRLGLTRRAARASLPPG